MKIFTILLITLLTMTTSHATYQPITSVGSCDKLYYQSKDCATQGICAELTVDCNYAELKTIITQKSDTSNPIVTVSEEVTCQETVSNLVTCEAVLDDVETGDVNEALTAKEQCNILAQSFTCEEGSTISKTDTTLSCVESEEDNCKALLEAKICAEGVALSSKSAESSKVFCQVTTYPLVDVYTYSTVENAVKKAAYLERRIEEAGMALAQARMDHGSKVISFMVYRNSLKLDLTQDQVSAMVSTYATIKALLETGSLNTAKTAIEALTVDGTIITELDKSKLISKIEEYSDL